ncbi:DUF2202 domain-containing protein [Magnetovirga frankeli]|uniref:DUF2202 domain-containing protein n=1 Tax=Magnetovirga frankeli TaxID=947516 RepID=UPI001293ADE9|nr:DUF2202 domain-containing protein [gamma proteobacterium SS-5]
MKQQHDDEQIPDDIFDEPPQPRGLIDRSNWAFNRQTLLIGLSSMVLGIGGLFLLFQPSQTGPRMQMTAGQAANAPAQFAQNAALNAPQPVGNLSQQEMQHLLYMREEEKLALDVYSALYQKWKLSLFASISRSEQRHTSAIANLLARYGLQDPAANSPPGQFSNSHLAKLYQDLMQKGQKSTLDAMHVGALIEEVDIQDLDTALQGTNKPDIQRVYQNIQRGSYHHLRAFAHGIELYGQPYKAQLLGQERVNQIIHNPLFNPLNNAAGF